MPTISVSSIEKSSISLGLGVSRPLSVVGIATIGSSVSSIAKTIAISGIAKTVSSIVVGISISLGLSISRPLSVVAIAIGSIAISITGIAKTVSVSTISKVVGISIGLGLGISRPLGDVDDSGGVGNISASTGIASSHSGDGSRGESSDASGVSTIGHSVFSSIGSGIGVGTIGIGSSSIASIAISSIQQSSIGISLSVDSSSETNHNSELVHVELLNVPSTMPM